MKRVKCGCSIKSSREHCPPYDVPFRRTAFQSFLIDNTKVKNFFGIKNILVIIFGCYLFYFATIFIQKPTIQFQKQIPFFFFPNSNKTIVSSTVGSISYGF